MKPYSMDLRQKVMEAVQAGGSTEAIGARFAIDGSCVRKWRLRVLRGEGLEPTSPPPGREREFNGKHDAELQRAVQNRAGATRAELAEAVGETLGRVFSNPVITRALQRLGFTRKKRRSRRAKGTAPRSKPRAKVGRSIRISKSSTG
jgi:transposase